jgi:sarcosine oxidase subunit alpha
MAGHAVGQQMHPTRRTTLHNWHAANGAVWLDAGLWKRPAYYPRASDADPWASVLREARAVREDVHVREGPGQRSISTLHMSGQNNY